MRKVHKKRNNIDALAHAHIYTPSKIALPSIQQNRFIEKRGMTSYLRSAYQKSYMNAFHIRHLGSLFPCHLGKINQFPKFFVGTLNSPDDTIQSYSIQRRCQHRYFIVVLRSIADTVQQNDDGDCE